LLARLSRDKDLSVRIPSPSAIGLLLVFGLTAYGGIELVAYQSFSDRVSVELFRQDRTGQESGGADSSAILSWTDVTGVSGWARGLFLAAVRGDTPGDKGAIAQAAEHAAEVSPTWAAGWQDVAAARLANGAPIEQVAAALHASKLTGSHEGFVVVRRALFGLEHWTDLLESDRRTVIDDVLATVGMHDHVNAEYHRLLAAKPAGERDEIRAAFVASGLATKDILRALGI
jgi:hypothetical protein